RAAGGGLATTGLAHHAHQFAAADGEADAVHRVDGPAAAAEHRTEVFDAEQVGPVHRSSMARMTPSAMALKLSTVRNTARPGPRATHHWPVAMSWPPALIIAPQLGSVGEAPMPMNDRAA